MLRLVYFSVDLDDYISSFENYSVGDLLASQYWNAYAMAIYDLIAGKKNV